MRRHPSSVKLPKMAIEDTTATPVTRKPNSLQRVLKSAILPLLAAFYYISASTTLTLVNKVLFAAFPASNPPFLLLFQSIAAVFILSILRLMGKFSAPNPLQWSSAAWKTYAPLYISNLSMLLTSLIALKLTSLLMYNTLRRTSMIFVVTIHCVMNNTTPSLYTIAATALVSFGALVASRTDLAFEPIGYGLAFAANISTAIYLVLLKPVRDKLQLSNLQLVYVNALSNIPVLALVMITMPPEPEFLENFIELDFCLLFFCSCTIAVVINHAVFVNTTTNDAIATSIASQIKDVALLIISILLVDDPEKRASGNLQGVGVAFAGSAIYCLGKLRQQLANPPVENRQKNEREPSAVDQEKKSLVEE